MSINNQNAALRIREIVSNEVLDNSENFVDFLKAYYDWLHTSTFDIAEVTGTFVAGEYVVGQTTKSSGRIVQLKTGQLIVFIESSLPFKRGETIIGQTSAAQAELSGITDNILRSSANLVNNRDLEKSVDKFADYLKYELYQSVPNEISGDKLLLTKKIRDFYQSKSQESAYRFLFKSLFNQEIELLYPGEDIIRVSDGKFSQTKVLRAVVNQYAFDFLFKTIRGVTSNAIANVVDIKLIYIGSVQVAEMTLSLASGTFIAGETIFDIADNDISTTLYGVISGFTINDPGTGYSEGDELQVNGDGQGAIISVSSVFKSPIDALKINSTGYGYRLNTYATVNNTGTNGTDLIVKVTEIADTYTVSDGPTNYTVGKVNKIRIVNKGYGYTDIPTITLQDSTIKNLGLLHEGLFDIVDAGNNYSIGDWLSFSSAYGANANAIIASVGETDVDLLLEDGTNITLEDSFYLKNETATFVGPINRIRVTNYGSGYSANSLPTITVNTSTGSNANIIVLGIQGTGANVEVDVANNSSGIGAIRSITITDFGADYSNATIDTSVSGNGDANITPIISGIGISAGQFINDDGKIDYKKIQDSYYYQDFSYVIRSGIEISTYKDIVKKIIHPAGLEFFGEIRIVSEFEVTMDAVSEINLEHIGAWIFTLINQIQTKAQISSGKKLEVDIIPDKVTGTTISAIEPEKHIIAPKGIVTIKADVEPKENKEVDLVIVLEEESLVDFVSDDTVEVNLLQNVDLSTDHHNEKLSLNINLDEDLSPNNVSDDVIEVKFPPQKIITQIDASDTVEVDFIQSFVVDSTLVEEKKTILLKDNSDPNDAAIEFNTSYESEIVIEEDGVSTNALEPSPSIWGSIPISFEANTTISSQSSTNFLSPYYAYEPTYHSVLVFTKKTGTVSTFGNNTIIGLGTTFETEFVAGDYMIIGDDKFTVSAVTSNTEMSILVDSSTNYSDYAIYKL